MKADRIIHHGLSQATNLDLKSYQLAGSKWNQLKELYLETSNTSHAMKLMTMMSWDWDSSKENKIQAANEMKCLLNEFIEINGGEQVNIKDLVLIWYL